ncbi:MAG: right-handed parallel beta-helix repeat-containing protein [Candidatus Helarchaeota archaeon]
MKQPQKHFSMVLIGIILVSAFLIIPINLINLGAIFGQDTTPARQDPGFLKEAGQDWTDFVVVSENSTNYGERPAIAVDAENNVHIVWYDDSAVYDGETYDDIMYRMWNASTGSWSATTLISTISTSNANNPDIAVDADGNVHVVWQDQTNIYGAGSNYDIFYRYWNASTRQWGGHIATYDLLTSGHTEICINPAIAIDTEGNVHVVWEDNNDLYGDGPNYDIFYRYWNSSTGIWWGIEVVSNESSSNSYTPDLAISSEGDVCVVWADITDLGGIGTDRDIFYRMRNASTGLWGGFVNNTDRCNTAASSYTPSITIDDGGNVHLAWYDGDSSFGAGSDYDILYRYWNNSTKSWGGRVNLNYWDVVSEISMSSYYPKIANDKKGNIFVIWQQYGSFLGTDYHYDIALRVWNVSLGWWDSQELVSSFDPSDSNYPDLVVDATGALQVVWQEYGASGDWDIIYRKTITMAPPSPKLHPILPNPTANLEIDLSWEKSFSAKHYYIYRNSTFITSIGNLTPIATVTETTYTDVVSANGTYYYVISAGNSIGNSSISNCENVTVFSLKQNRRITITSNADFPNYASQGNGSSGDPWILENYYIDGVRRDCITIANTTDYFILRNSTVYKGNKGIYLENVQNGILQNNTARFCNIGFHLKNSQNNYLLNNTAYNNTGLDVYSGLGFFLEFSDYNVLSYNYAFNNSGIKESSYSGDGFLLWSASYNNFTNNWAFSNFHYNTTYTTLYGGIGFLGLSSSAYNNFIRNVAYSNRGFVGYSSMGIFFMSSGQGNYFEENLVFNHSNDGIYFRNSAANNEFINNTLYNNNYGLRLIGTGQANIRYNKLFNNNYGAYLWGGSSTVYGNRVWDNSQVGIYFVASGNDVAANNTIWNNSGTGISLINSANIQFYNNTIYQNTDGINLLNAQSCTVINNKVYNNSHYGITFYDNFTTLMQNTISGNDVGIYAGSPSSSVSSTTFLKCSTNEITDNRIGIYLLKNINSTIENNTIFTNRDYGIFSENSRNISIIYNSVTNSQINIHLLNNYNSTIAFNRIYHSDQYSVYLEKTYKSKVIWNEILNHTQWIQLINASDITVENNSIYNDSAFLWPISPNPIENGWVHLKWDSVLWATYYLIYRKPQAAIDALWDLVEDVPIKNVSSSVTELWDTKLPSTGIYSYVIIAGNATGWSRISNSQMANVTGLYSTPGTPILEPILPAIDYDGVIHLDWSDDVNSTHYYVYRDTTEIFNVTGLTPIAQRFSSDYIDTLTENGTYYYVIVGANPEENGTRSNCENVTVLLVPSPETPTLNPILPNPDYDGVIHLEWASTANTTWYYIYRDTAEIINISTLTPIATVLDSNYTDYLYVSGTFYYAILASNLGRNGTLSNCENVTVEKCWPVGNTLLDQIQPSTDTDGIIQLNWLDAENATYYYIYKDAQFITNISALTPIASSNTSSYLDFAPINGTFYYAILPLNPVFVGSISNIERVEVVIPSRQTTGWTLPQIISRSSSADSITPRMAMDAEGNIYAVWADDSNILGAGTDKDIFCRIWNKSKGIWENVILISDWSDLDSINPAISTDSVGNLYIAWVDYTDWLGSGADADIYFRIYNATTGTWGQTDLVTANSHHPSLDPSLVVDKEGSVNLVWWESNGSQTNIYKTFWNPIGNIWSENTTISEEILGDSRYPQIAVDDASNFHVVWEASSSSFSSGSDDDIFYRMWNDSLQAWQTTELVSTLTFDSNRPTLTVDASGNVYVAWHDLAPYSESGPDSDIFFKFRDVHTGIWAGFLNSTDLISWESDRPSLYPKIAIDKQLNIHLCWVDYSDIFGAGFDADIFYKVFNRSTSIWNGYVNSTDVISSESSDDSFAGFILTGSLHIIWQDKTNYGFGADWDIYYKKLILVPPEPPEDHLTTPEGDWIWLLILIVGIVAAATAVFIMRMRHKEADGTARISKSQLKELRSILREKRQIIEKLKVLQKYKIPIPLISELLDQPINQFFEQNFVPIPLSLLEFLQKLDAPLEDKLEILTEYRHLPNELKKEFLEELLNQQAENL